PDPPPPASRERWPPSAVPHGARPTRPHDRPVVERPASRRRRSRRELVETTSVPQRVELAERAAKLVPLLRANALWEERNRRLADETVEALTAAGIFGMRIPKRYGGDEFDGNTMVDVGTEPGPAGGGA